MQEKDLTLSVHSSWTVEGQAVKACGRRLVPDVAKKHVL